MFVVVIPFYQNVGSTEKYRSVILFSKCTFPQQRWAKFDFHYMIFFSIEWYFRPRDQLFLIFERHEKNKEVAKKCMSAHVFAIFADRCIALAQF